jgi:hypothetical protein
MTSLIIFPRRKHICGAIYQARILSDPGWFDRCQVWTRQRDVDIMLFNIA